jgi:hypothetical protein
MLKNMGRLSLGQASRGNGLERLYGETKDGNEWNQCVPICDAIS